ncbi:hypothetical protein [Allomuricauda sp. CP2A]|mgnify:CR=1 FL=1|jgi:protein-arginine kinase activator protein McsA|uniref:hypothetical protein n=1 Tax=Allomuricauda sp. CP2A TaxID=1848189 RepID=UPI0008357EDD|nr:hypothetical protein [Muricauda sp. CP2A]
MALIFSLNRKQEIENQISIDEYFILQDDEFISIEIGNGFDWYRHSQNCSDCGNFLKSIGSNSFNWFLKSDNKIFMLDLNEFDSEDNHFTNSLSLINSKDFFGTKAKFRKLEASEQYLNKLRIQLENNEEYERCASLRDAIKFLKRK